MKKQIVEMAKKTEKKSLKEMQKIEENKKTD